MDNRRWNAENVSLGFPFATDSEKHELLLRIQNYIETCHNTCDNFCPDSRKQKVWVPILGHVLNTRYYVCKEIFVSDYVRFWEQITTKKVQVLWFI